MRRVLQHYWWTDGPDERGELNETAAGHLIQCRNCGFTQTQPRVERRELVSCSRCNTQLEHGAGKSLPITLACSASLLLLLIPACLAPFLTTSALGATLTSYLPMSVSTVWNDGAWLLAIAVCLFVLIFPVIRFGLLTLVLGYLQYRTRPSKPAGRWLARLFRICNGLQTWAMLDVFLLGLLVAYFRLRSSLVVNLEPGAVCFVIAGILSLFTRATLDKAEVWRLIAPDRQSISGEIMLCLSCELVLEKSDTAQLCPRCCATVRAREVHSNSRSVALLLAAGLLYIPANVYPIATIPIDLTPTAYTVLGGVVDLAKSHLIGLATLVFTASFTIPLLKMLGLAWCASSAMCGSCRFLVGKTRAYRIIEEIGRWSMVDPLTIACFVPALKFNALIDGYADPAAAPFAAVAILTTFAVQYFDPRTMWDAAERNS